MFGSFSFFKRWKFILFLFFKSCTLCEFLHCDLNTHLGPSWIEQDPRFTAVRMTFPQNSTTKSTVFVTLPGEPLLVCFIFFAWFHLITFSKKRSLDGSWGMIPLNLDSKTLSCLATLKITWGKNSLKSHLIFLTPFQQLISKLKLLCNSKRGNFFHFKSNLRVPIFSY